MLGKLSESLTFINLDGEQCIMKKGEVAVGKVTKSMYQGKGVIEREDGSVLIKHAIEGQVVEYLISKKRNGRAEGRILKVLEKSSLEDAKDCCSHTECGGCSYQSISYDNQISIKNKQIIELLKDAADEDFLWEGIIKSPSEFNYRNKMEFSFGDEVKDGPLSLGLHKRASHYDVVNTPNCNIVHEDFNVIQAFTREFFANRDVSYFHKHSRAGFLRHLIVRRSAVYEEILINIVTTSALNTKIEDRQEVGVLDKTLTDLINDWLDGLLKLEESKLRGKIVGVIHTINNSYADAVVNQESKILYGRDYIYENLLGLKFKISSFSFFQTNSKGAEVLYKSVIDYVGDTEGKFLYDLYSGTGTIAQLLSKYAKKVYAIEIVEEAVKAACENAKLNAIDNCVFMCGDVLKLVDELAGKVDIIVLDPPRDGIHPKALPKIIDFGAEKIVYVSCKPSSLARDLRLLQDSGYRMKKAVGVDMFPNTSGVEVVALLEKISKRQNKYV